MNKEGVRYNTAAVAVADAMMLAQVRMLDDERFFGEQNPYLITPRDKTRNRDYWSQRLTKNNCWRGVSDVMEYLAFKHPEKFTTIIALAADRRDAEFTMDWNRHYNFLAQDKTGQWYAGSPANHQEGEGKKSRLFSPIISYDLREVLENLQQRDGGQWPEKEHILPHIGSIPQDEYLTRDKEWRRVGRVIEKSGISRISVSEFELFRRLE